MAHVQATAEVQDTVSRVAILTADQLTDGEREFLADKLQRERADREQSVRWREESLEESRKRLETSDADTAPVMLRLLTARRLLAESGVEFRQGWNNDLIVELGHVAHRDAEYRLAELSRVLGSFNPDGKTVDVTEVHGRKVLAIILPSRRWPVEVRYTTPSSKKLACRIVKDVRHSVVCTEVG